MSEKNRLAEDLIQEFWEVERYEGACQVRFVFCKKCGDIMYDAEKEGGMNPDAVGTAIMAHLSFQHDVW